MYDFDVPAGDSYKGISFDRTTFMNAEYADIHVLATDIVTVWGEEMRVQKVRAGDDCPEVIIVEGVGPSRGTIHKPQLTDDAESEGVDIYLEKMTDLRGNILFTGEDFKTIENKLNDVESLKKESIDVRISDNKVTAAGSSIEIFSTGGARVLTGRGAVNVESLKHGTYIARVFLPGSAPAMLKFTR